MKRKSKCIWALLLSLALSLTQLPLTVMAETTAENMDASAGYEEEIPEIIMEEENTVITDRKNLDMNTQLEDYESVSSADETVLEVAFDDNDNIYEMEDAIEDATKNIDEKKITTIRLSGTAEELSGSNWDELRFMYSSSNYKYQNLSILDLSGLNQLKILSKEGQHGISLKKLQTVIFPDSLQTIGKDAFYNCNMLTSPNLPTSLQIIGDSAFRGCSSLTELVFPDSLEVIGRSAFISCSSLNSLTFNDGLKTISNNAFSSCSSLLTVALPESLQTIEDLAFQSRSITTLTVDANNPYYSATDSVLYDKDATTLLLYAPGKTDSSFTVPETVQTINAYAFSYCNNLNTLIIPERVTAMETLTIHYCESLSAIIVDENNPQYTSEDGVLYDKNQKTLLRYPLAKSDASFRVPASVSIIGEYAFRNCSELSAIILPENVNLFDYSAFAYCSSLNSIAFLGDTPPREAVDGYNYTFSGVPDNGTIYYPNASTSYTDNWKNTIKLSTWSLIPAYRLEVESGTDISNNTLYESGATVTIKADAPPAGQSFDKWITEGAGIIDDASSEQTTFTMPAENTKVTATYKNSVRPPGN